MPEVLTSVKVYTTTMLSAHHLILSVVKEKPPVVKSMLASKNLPKPIRKDEDCAQWIKVLCSELAVRLLEARETGIVWPKTIALHTRQGAGISF